MPNPDRDPALVSAVRDREEDPDPKPPVLAEPVASVAKGPKKIETESEAKAEPFRIVGGPGE